MDTNGYRYTDGGDLGKKGEIVGEIIFAGDSFVYGEGLDYESNCPIIKDLIKHKNVEAFIQEGVSYAAIEFRKDNRFATLVANRFRTKSHVYERNGGDNYSCLDELLYMLKSLDLTKVTNIIFQPTSVLRTLDIGLHPIEIGFGTMDSDHTSELANYTLSTRYSILSGKGFEKLNIHKKDHFDVPHHYEEFEMINNDLNILMQFCLKYETTNDDVELKNWIQEGHEDLRKYKDQIISKKNWLYDFFITEFSHYGNSVIQIVENIEKQLVKDLVKFIQLEVLPKIQGYPIFFQFLQTWSTEDKIWEELESELDFYKNNVIRLDKNWEDAKHDYEIERQEGMEWTRNMHPNVEGHKWFSHTIIEQIH